MLKRFIKIGSAAIAAFNVAIAGAGPDVNSGEFFNQPYLQGLGVVPAWQAGLLGGGIVVANLDSGIRDTHVDLVGTIVPGGYDFVNDDDDPFDDELSLTYGHGTASAGIIVGNWNGVGVGGIAPNAKILPVKITNDQNLTDGGLISQGVLYAAARPEVRIILLEAVGPSTSPAEFAALGTAVANGKLVIAPAGNQGQASPANPASNFGSLGSSALVVGSNNGAGGRSVFSNGAAGVENNYITA
ncbi:MAG: S8/S53 family peptidase, partial [Quisquiliibacterium sp.]